LESIAGGFDNHSELRADGAGSRLELPQLTTMVGTGRNGEVVVHASAGGVVDATALAQITGGAVQVSATGSDADGHPSLVDLTGLQSWVHSNTQRSSFVT